MKIVLINPPSLYLANDASYPPSGLLYVAAALEQLGHRTEIIDLTGGIDWEAEVSALTADLVGITCVTPNVNIVQKIAAIIPPGIPIILGGAHPTFLPEDTLRNIRCNAVIEGEAEGVIFKVIDDLQRGILRRIYQGGVAAISDIPKPARQMVNLHKYRPGAEIATPIYASRGCPFECAFCSKITNQTYRIFSIPRIIEEVQEVMEIGFDRIIFGDDDIAMHSGLKELLKELRPLHLKIRLNQSARMVREELLKMAVESGCYEISFGIESGSQQMLDRMNKQSTVEDNELAICMCKRYGIKTKAYFLVNFPGETTETIEETLRFAERTRPDKWLLSAFAPLPGSQTFRYPEKYGITWMSKNWEDYYLVGKDGSFKPCFLSQELTVEKQIYLHDTLFTKLREILGKQQLGQ